jgi:hypothetical protein
MRSGWSESRPGMESGGLSIRDDAPSLDCCVSRPTLSSVITRIILFRRLTGYKRRKAAWMIELLPRGRKKATEIEDDDHRIGITSGESPVCSPGKRRVPGSDTVVSIKDRSCRGVGPAAL